MATATARLLRRGVRRAAAAAAAGKTPQKLGVKPFTPLSWYEHAAKNDEMHSMLEDPQVNEAVKVKVTYVDLEGNRTAMEGFEGEHLLSVGLRHGVPFRDGTCGGGPQEDEYGEGACCSHCHVKIPTTWLRGVPAPDRDEFEMLREAQDTSANSRLACQVRLSKDLDGIVVGLGEAMPETID